MILVKVLSHQVHYGGDNNRLIAIDPNRIPGHGNAGTGTPIPIDLSHTTGRSRVPAPEAGNANPLLSRNSLAVPGFPYISMYVRTSWERAHVTVGYQTSPLNVDFGYGSCTFTVQSGGGRGNLCRVSSVDRSVN